MLYASDFDPERSHAELVAYLLVHGDARALTGESHGSGPQRRLLVSAHRR